MPANDRPDDAARRLRAANLRTALVLAGIALVFFAGVILTRFVGGPDTGIAVLGVAVLLYLGLAIGRHLRRRGRS